MKQSKITSIATMVVFLHAALVRGADSETKKPRRSKETPSPTVSPTFSPTHPPTFSPTTSQPTTKPKKSRSSRWTNAPTVGPSPPPSLKPTGKPSSRSTPYPSSFPTPGPSLRPTPFPSVHPTPDPSSLRTPGPTFRSTGTPQVLSTPGPSVLSTSAPSPPPTRAPYKSIQDQVAQSTSAPIRATTLAPSPRPTSAPSRKPTSDPSARPTLSPTSQPTVSPSANPLGAPSKGPSLSPSRPPIDFNPRANLDPNSVSIVRITNVELSFPGGPVEPFASTDRRLIEAVTKKWFNTYFYEPREVEDHVIPHLQFDVRLTLQKLEPNKRKILFDVSMGSTEYDLLSYPDSTSYVLLPWTDEQANREYVEALIAAMPEAFKSLDQDHLDVPIIHKQTIVLPGEKDDTTGAPEIPTAGLIVASGLFCLCVAVGVLLILKVRTNVAQSQRKK